MLALKSYCEWKQGGGIGSWKFGGNPKPVPCAKPIVRKNSEPFMSSLSRSSSVGEWSLDNSERLSFSDLGQENTEMVGDIIVSNLLTLVFHLIR